MKTIDKIKPRACRIINTKHPECGAFGVMDDTGEHLEIRGRGGSRILHYTEANDCWEVVE